MYRRFIDAEQPKQKTKPRLHKASVMRRIQIGDVIAVEIAHEWQRDYGWSNYSTTKYKVEKISKKEIVGRNVDHAHEIISISRSDLDECRFIINGT